MEKPGYKIIIEVGQPPELVFNSICDIPKWWSRDFYGRCSSLGDEFTIHHPDLHFSKQKLIEFIPGERMVWLVTESWLPWLKADQQEWTGTKMEFMISSEGAKVRILFVHEGLTPEKECYHLCAQGWDIVIGDWLPYYIHSGIPSEDMDRAAEIRNRHFDSQP